MKLIAERTLDELGRIVIPVEMRRELDAEPFEKLLLACEDGKIVIKKALPRCKLCGADMSDDDEFVICQSCIADIKSMK